MTPTFYRVVTPDCDHAALYFVSNISDIKVWEGSDYISNALPAMAEVMGHPFEEWDFTNEDEVDGGTPEKFMYIKHKKKRNYNGPSV
jgi:hypothetical protein